jgi:acyl dehydratase
MQPHAGVCRFDYSYATFQRTGQKLVDASGKWGMFVDKAPNQRICMKPEGIHYDAFITGKVYHSDRRTITEADHVNFTTSFGFFEPLFMDREYVEEQTPYKARIVPGTMTFSIAEGLTILSGILHGTGIAFLGVALKVTKPVFIGDTIRVEIEVADKRETKRADRGIVTFLHRVMNQKDEVVMEYRIQRMIRRQA